LKLWHETPTHGRSDQINEFLELCFDNLLNNFEFLSVVMYPDYKNRRHFVHEAWLIAKFTENFELKMAISNDPYFFLTRQDILQLIRTNDDDMIEHMLKIQVAL
jgi:cystathionine beta-lyase family protein involved in aluminum resistance